MIKVFYLIYIHNLISKDKEALRELSEEIIRLLNGYRSAILTPNSYLLTSELENK